MFINPLSGTSLPIKCIIPGEISKWINLYHHTLGKIVLWDHRYGNKHNSVCFLHVWAEIPGKQFVGNFTSTSIKNESLYDHQTSTEKASCLRLIKIINNLSNSFISSLDNKVLGTQELSSIVSDNSLCPYNWNAFESVGVISDQWSRT